MKKRVQGVEGEWGQVSEVVWREKKEGRYAVIKLQPQKNLSKKGGQKIETRF